MSTSIIPYGRSKIRPILWVEKTGSTLEAHKRDRKWQPYFQSSKPADGWRSRRETIWRPYSQA